jgi:hypothetical protein
MFSGDLGNIVSKFVLLSDLKTDIYEGKKPLDLIRVRKMHGTLVPDAWIPSNDL